VARSSGQRLLGFDRKLDVRYVAGADEAGRGSLAGPLVVAGVLFDYEELRGARVRPLAALNDSKQVPVHEREMLFGAVASCATAISVRVVPVRAIEYLVAMPLLPAPAPHWLSTLHFAMTFDVVLFSSLYMVAFVAALRRVPLFPRLLLAIWLGDLAMQLFTASLVSSAGDVPQRVVVALHSMLEGNVKKVLISMALWLPYLLLSTRVNVTYRHRIPA